MFVEYFVPRIYKNLVAQFILFSLGHGPATFFLAPSVDVGFGHFVRVMELKLYGLVGFVLGHIRQS